MLVQYTDIPRIDARLLQTSSSHARNYACPSNSAQLVQPVPDVQLHWVEWAGEQRPGWHEQRVDLLATVHTDKSSMPGHRRSRTENHICIYEM